MIETMRTLRAAIVGALARRLDPARRERRARRAVRCVASGLLCAVSLSACQAVPGAGPVREGLENLSQGEQRVQFNPGGPMNDATQEQIVRGFVRAATSSVDDYRVAREFLTPEYAALWEPDDGVFVDEGTQPYRTVAEDVGQLSVSGLATVDALGTLTPLKPGPPTVMRFEFAEVDGQWRIASAPSGVILDRTSFSAVWAKVQLYFVTPDERLVSEPRWFLNGSTLSTQIVNALIAGPTETSGSALRTAFPRGSALSTSAVPVNGGVARIEFTPEILTSESQNLDLIHQQIAASLQSVPDVNSFEISVNGSVVDSGSVLVQESPVRSTENLVTTVLREGELGALSAGKITSLPRIGERIARLRPNAVALAADRRSAAIRHRSDGRSTVSWVSESEVVALDVRAGLFEPSLDRFGYVWSYATSQPAGMLVQLPGGEAQFLNLPGLAGGAPVAIRVSPGGDRLAILTRSDTETTTVITVSIVRDQNSQPVALAPFAVTELIVPGTAVDVDWVDEQRVVALSRSGPAVRVTISSLGGLPADAGVVANAVAVSGGGSRALIRVLDRSGRLYAPLGSGWQWQSDDVTLIARSG